MLKAKLSVAVHKKMKTNYSLFPGSARKPQVYDGFIESYVTGSLYTVTRNLIAAAAGAGPNLIKKL